MMIALPFDFPGKVFRSPMPFGPFDHTGLWKNFQDKRIDGVVVLTEPQEYLVYASRDLPTFYRDQGMKVIHIPVPDFNVPQNLDAWKKGLENVIQWGKDGKNIAVHCLAGLGRAGTFLACLAVFHQKMSGNQALKWVRNYVPGAIMNTRQEKFVIQFESLIEH